jgi:hypothetical protein
MVDVADKIIPFPQSKIFRETTKIPLEEVMKEKQFRSTQKFGDAVTEEIAGIILNELDNYDFDLETEIFTKDWILAQESLKAVIYRSIGIDHHLHPFTDNNVSLIAMTPEDGEISDKKFKKKMKKFMKEMETAEEGIDDKDV